MQGHLNQKSLLSVGTVVAGRYEIIATPYLGRRKAVYRCRMTKAAGREAILLVPLADGADFVEPLISEQETLPLLSHSGIVIMIECGEEKKIGRFTALEYVDGPTLALAMSQERRLELGRTINLFAQICSALGYLHKHDILHGSLKANHIIIQQKPREEESIKLIDFSQAQLRGRKRRLQMSDWIDVFQTVGHPSPEELAGETIDQRADIYSLGCLLYKVLTGKAPFNGTSAEEIRRKHIEEMPPPLLEAFPQGGFSAKLEECVQKMLAKTPEKRHQSVDDLALELRFAARRVSPIQ